MYENTKGRSTAASMEMTSTAKTKFDEFLRRQLGVTDARDPKSVVNALRKLYPTTAARLDDESRGQPIRVQATPEPSAGVMVSTGDSPGMRRFRQQRQALQDDLRFAVELASNRDFREPVDGWRDSILAEMDEGEAASYRAVDPVARDRTFYTVRKLGDCARVARMVGMINPTVSPEFGRLASTLDEGSMLLRILAGESLFRAGFDKGGTVFQVALQDLRQRREALINALEQLTATSIQEGGDDWGDGQASYGKLLERLRTQGQSDLRSIVRPDAMSRLLDVLLNHAPRAQTEDMRGIASAVPMELLQLRRLRDVAGSLLDASGFSNASYLDPTRGQGASAPLAAFTEALTLFINAFDQPNAGARLLNMVLPAPLAFQERADKEQELHDKFRERAVVQEQVDELLMDPTTADEFWKELARLDRKLYHIDRIIDLYLLDYDEATIPGGGNRVVFHSEMLEQLDDNVDVFVLDAAFLKEQCGLEEDTLALANTLTQGAEDRVEDIEEDRNHKFSVPAGSHCNVGEQYQVPPPMRVSLDRLERHFPVYGVDGPQPNPTPPPPRAREATDEASAMSSEGASMEDVTTLIQQNRAQILTELDKRLEAQGPELARQLEQAFSDQLKAVERLLAGKEPRGSDGKPAAVNGYTKTGHTRRHVRHARKP
ncbi:hypothetical protein D7X74_24810 [Corallococcus sp. CA047B]|uniref:hypothetical protein n=1 Tax=Corallococcus sp. CA047B TaxID=2316729 RepID=UPI000EA1CA93|nr:hypothetical protein [Corallococcus sp. CA047B]RKH11787.1 hypothetical protein D7X74_24810 [Corallococcus sp. CA047B]